MLVRVQPSAQCGYSIVVTMRPCQGRVTGSNPVTRSDMYLSFVLEYLVEKYFGVRSKRNQLQLQKYRLSRHFNLGYKEELMDKKKAVVKRRRF